MNIKSAYQFQLRDHLRSAATYYGILVAVYILLGIGLLTVKVNGQTSFNGMDMATLIFLFVSGVVCFRESFLMLMQNSVSRKTIFISRILATLTFAGGMAVGDKIILLLGKLFTGGSTNITFNSLFEQIYSPTFVYEQINSAPFVMENPFLKHIIMLVFSFLFYLLMFALGYFISVVFFRSNKVGRVALGAGIPVGLFVLYPIIDFSLFGGKISMSIVKFMDFSLGITTGNPYAALISFTIGFILLSMLSWLVMRKAAVKA